jgi:hypothetical protein
VESKQTRAERREQRRQNARKMGVSGASLKRVYPAAVEKRVREVKE